MNPFSTRENDDDRDAIVSDVSEGSDIEGSSGMAMYAAFDRSRDQSDGKVDLLGKIHSNCEEVR